MKKDRRFYLCSMIVSGTQYHSPQSVGAMGEADTLELDREPSNIYDPLAIAVLWEGTRIGYVPRQHVALLSSLLDNGYQIQAAVDEAAQGIVSMNLWMFR